MRQVLARKHFHDNGNTQRPNNRDNDGTHKKYRVVLQWQREQQEGDRNGTHKSTKRDGRVARAHANHLVRTCAVAPVPPYRRRGERWTRSFVKRLENRRK